MTRHRSGKLGTRALLVFVVGFVVFGVMLIVSVERRMADVRRNAGLIRKLTSLEQAVRDLGREAWETSWPPYVRRLDELTDGDRSLGDVGARLDRVTMFVDDMTERRRIAGSDDRARADGAFGQAREQAIDELKAAVADARLRLSGISRDLAARWRALSIAVLVACGVAVMLAITALRHERTLAACRKFERDLEASRDAAQAGSRAKSRFLASVSHELRTPLNAIMGYSYVLEQEASDRSDGRAIDDLKCIQTAGRHLLRLIDDLLDLSRIEAGRLTVNLESFGVSELVDEIASTVRPLVARNANELHVSCAADVDAMHSDQTRVRQILLNLLSNACRFSEQGRIDLGVTRHRDNERDWIRFTVADSGIGMSPAEIRAAFEEFTQPHVARGEHDRGGVGLGLPLTKRLCRALGGDVAVVSEPGQGSAFTVTLPASPAVRGEPRSGAAPPGQPPASPSSAPSSSGGAS